MLSGRFRNLRARLIVIIAGTVIFPLLAAAAVLLRIQSDAAKANTRNTFNFTERLLQQQIARRVDSTVIATRRLVGAFSDGSFGHFNPSDLTTAYLSRQSADVRLDAVAVFDLSGRQISSVRSSALESAQIPWKAILATQKQQEYSGGFFTNNSFILVHSLPLQLKFKNQVTQLRVVGISLFDAWNLDQIQSVTKVHLTLVDNGIKRVTTVFDRFGQDRLTGPLELKRHGLNLSREEVIESPADAIQRSLRTMVTVLNRPGEAYQGHLLLEMEGQAGDGEAKQAQILLLLIIGFAVLLAIVAGILVARMIVRPIFMLRDHVRDFDVLKKVEAPPSLHAVGEIADLSSSFLQMTKQVQGSFKRIRRIHSASRKFAVTFEKKALFELSAHEISKALGASTGRIFLLNPETKELECIAATSKTQEEGAPRLDALRTDNLIELMRTARHSAFFQASPETRVNIFQNEGTLLKDPQLLAIPLFSGGETIGIMIFGWSTDDERASEILYAGEALASSLMIQLQNIEFLAQTRKSAELEAEFRAARAVQDALLPLEATFPGLDVFTSYTSAAITGGDWYGFFYNRARHELDVLIADVTGHGFPSALLTGVLCGALYASEETLALLSSADQQPEERLQFLGRILNRIIAQTGRQERVASMLFLTLQLDTGDVTVLNAGHHFPYHIQPDKKKAISIVASGHQLGFNEIAEFGVAKTKLEPNDGLFLYTDGLVENHGGTREKRLTNRNLKNLLAKSDDVAEIATELPRELRHLWGDVPPDDDVTTILVKWHGPIEPLSWVDEETRIGGRIPGYIPLA